MSKFKRLVAVIAFKTVLCSSVTPFSIAVAKSQRLNRFNEQQVMLDSVQTGENMGAFAQRRVAEEPTEDQRKEMLSKLGKYIEFASKYKVPADVQKTWKEKMTESRIDKLRERASLLGTFESKIVEFERNENYIGLGLLFLYTYTANLDDFRASQKTRVYNEVFLKPLEADLRKASEKERWNQPEEKVPAVPKRVEPSKKKENENAEKEAERKRKEEEAKAKQEEAKKKSEDSAKAEEEKKKAEKAEKQTPVSERNLEIALNLNRAIASKKWSAFEEQKDELLKLNSSDLKSAVRKYFYVGELFKICGEDVKVFKHLMNTLTQEHIVGTKSNPTYTLEAFIRDASALRNMMMSAVMQGGIESVSASGGQINAGVGINLLNPDKLQERLEKFMRLLKKPELNETLGKYFVSAVFLEDVFSKTITNGVELKVSDSWTEVVTELRRIGSSLNNPQLWTAISAGNKESAEEALSELARKLFSIVQPMKGGKIDETSAKAMFAILTGFGNVNLSFEESVGSGKTNFLPGSTVNVTIDQVYWEDIQQNASYISERLNTLINDDATRNNFYTVLYRARPDSILAIATMFAVMEQNQGMRDSALTISDTLLRISRYDPTLVFEWALAITSVSARAEGGDVQTAMRLINTNLSTILGASAQLSSQQRAQLYQIARELQSMKMDFSKGLLGRKTLLEFMTVENLTSQEIENFDASINHTGLGKALREGAYLAGEAQLLYMNTLTILGRFRHLMLSEVRTNPVTGVSYSGEFIATFTPERIKRQLLNQLYFYLPGQSIPDAGIQSFIPFSDLILGIQSAFMTGTLPMGYPFQRWTHAQGGLAYTATPNLDTVTTADIAVINVKTKNEAGEIVEREINVTEKYDDSWHFTSDGTAQGISYQLSKNEKGKWIILAEGGTVEASKDDIELVGNPKFKRESSFDEKKAGGGGIATRWDGENGAYFATGAGLTYLGEDNYLVSMGIEGANIKLTEGSGLVTGTAVASLQEVPGTETVYASSDSRWAFFSELAKTRQSDLLVLTNYSGETTELEGVDAQGKELKDKENEEGRVLAYWVRKDGTVSKAGYINYPDLDASFREKTLGVIADIEEPGVTGGGGWKEAKKNELGKKADNQEYFFALDAAQAAALFGSKDMAQYVNIAGAGIYRNIEDERMQRYFRGVEKEWAAGGALTFLNTWSVGALYSTLERRDDNDKKEYYRILGAYHHKGTGQSEVLARGFAGLGFTNGSCTDLFGYAETYGRQTWGMKEFYARLAGGSTDEKFNASTIKGALDDAEQAYVRVSGWVDTVFGAKFDNQTKLYLKAMYFRTLLEGEAWKTAKDDEGKDVFDKEKIDDSANILFLYGLFKNKNGIYASAVYSDARLDAFRNFMRVANDSKLDESDQMTTSFNNTAKTFRENAANNMRLRAAVGKEGRFHVGGAYDAPEERAEATGLVMTESGWGFGGTGIYQVVGRVENKEGEEETAEVITGTFIIGQKGNWRLELTAGFREFVNYEEQNVEAMETLMVKFLKSIGKDVLLSIAAGESGLATKKKLEEGQAEALIHITFGSGAKQHEVFFGVNATYGKLEVEKLNEQAIEKKTLEGKTYIDVPLGATFSLDEYGKHKLTLVLDAVVDPLLASYGALVAYRSSELEAGIGVQRNVSSQLRPDLRNPENMEKFLKSQTTNPEQLFATWIVRAFMKTYFYETD